MFNTIQLAVVNENPRKAFFKAIVIGTILTYLMLYIFTIWVQFREKAKLLEL